MSFIVPLYSSTLLFFMFKSNKYHSADHPFGTLGVEKQIKIEFGHCAKKVLVFET